MDNSIIVAIISGGLAFLGTFITTLTSHSKTIYRIEQLEIKQDKHNNLIERMYNVEKRVSILEEHEKNDGEKIKDLQEEIKSIAE